MTTTTTSVPTTRRPTPTSAPADRRVAMEQARVAYERLADVVTSLAPDDWARPTDCDGWTVRDLVGHVVGAMQFAASPRAMLSQTRAFKHRAKRTGENETDAMTAVQIERTAGLSPTDLVAAVRALAGPATTGRRRAPAPVRRFVRIRVEFGAISERWSIGYLVDLILTRDAWLHRIDLCRAIGTDPVLTTEHDGAIVADVVHEWAMRHGRPYRLTLTGPAGGSFGSEGTATDVGSVEVIELDAVEFCRIVSGRAAGDGLLRTEVPF